MKGHRVKVTEDVCSLLVKFYSIRASPIPIHKLSRVTWKVHLIHEVVNVHLGDFIARITLSASFVFYLVQVLSTTICWLTKCISDILIVDMLIV